MGGIVQPGDGSTARLGDSAVPQQHGQHGLIHAAPGALKAISHPINELWFVSHSRIGVQRLGAGMAKSAFFSSFQEVKLRLEIWVKSRS
jgi:hypothetical protein